MFQNFENLFNKIGHFFKGLFNSAQKAWKKLSPLIKKGLVAGSAIVALINKYWESAPQFVLDIIQKKLPGIDLAKLQYALVEVSKAFNIAININDPDLLVMIGNLQQYLGTLQGSLWANISEGIAKGIAVIFAPEGTFIAALSSLAVFVYHAFVKKPVEADEEITEYIQLQKIAA